MAKAQPKKPTSKAPAKPVELSQGQALIVDLSEVEEMSFENLPKANYPCVIDELTFEYSQNNNPMWRVVLEVERGEYAGRKLFTFITFSEAALPIAKKHISRIAPELLDGPFDPEEVANGGTLLNRRVVARVGIQKYQGEDRNNVKDLFGIDADDDFTQ